MTYPPRAVVLVPLMPARCVGSWLDDRLGPAGAPPPKGKPSGRDSADEPPYLVMPPQLGERDPKAPRWVQEELPW